MSTGKTIKAKNLRVPNPDYSPTINRWSIWIAFLLVLLVQFDLV